MFFKYCWKAMAITLLILVVSLLPGPDIPNVKIKYFDKLVHFCMYAGLCFFSINGFIKQTFLPSLRCFCCSFSFVYCMTYGGILELVQHYLIIDRTGDWFDFISNSAGAFVVSAFLAIKYKSL